MGARGAWTMRRRNGHTEEDKEGSDGGGRERAEENGGVLENGRSRTEFKVLFELGRVGGEVQWVEAVVPVEHENGTCVGGYCIACMHAFRTRGLEYGK